MVTVRTKLKRQKRWNDVTIFLSAFILVTFAVTMLTDHLFESVSIAFDSKSLQERIYQVKRGDTLWVIADEMLEPGEDIRDKIIKIRNLNGLTPSQSLTPGQVVRVPVQRATVQSFRYAFRETP